MLFVYGKLLKQILFKIAGIGDSLRQITKKKSPFVWGAKHTEAFESIKKEITSTTILKYYYCSKPLTFPTVQAWRSRCCPTIRRSHHLLCQQSLQPYWKAKVETKFDSHTVVRPQKKFTSHFCKDFSFKQKISLGKCSCQEYDTSPHQDCSTCWWDPSHMTSVLKKSKGQSAN